MVLDVLRRAVQAPARQVPRLAGVLHKKATGGMFHGWQARYYVVRQPERLPALMVPHAYHCVVAGQQQPSVLLCLREAVQKGG